MSFSSAISRSETIIELTKGTDAPFNGYLLDHKSYNEAGLAMVDLQLCENRLKKQDCSDSIVDEASKTREKILMIGVSFILGGIAGALIAN